jgi:nicotinate-nucleotide pyrophosphorylase (carboxylating)
MTFAAMLEAEIERNVAAALTEDVGSGDLTAQLVPAGEVGRASVIAREAAILCGCLVRALLQNSSTQRSLSPGRRVMARTSAPGQVLCEIEGPARALLTGERSALNFLQLLSGVATKARQYADLVAGTRRRRWWTRARRFPACGWHKSTRSDAVAAAITASVSMTAS